MSSKRRLELKGTLALRLSLWYALLFGVSALIAFMALYLLIRSVVYSQRDQSLRAEIKEFTMIREAGGLPELRAGMKWEVGSEGMDNIFLRLFSEQDGLVAETDLSAWSGLPPADPALARLKTAGEPVFDTLRLSGQPYPTRMITAAIGDGLVLQFGQSIEEDRLFLEILLGVFVPLMGGITLLAALSGWFLARRALAGVTEVAQAAVEISNGNFERRVAVKDHGAEIVLLATAFNHMLDHIDILFREMKEMNNNIAHDLRSPLARIRGAAEMALTTVTSMEESKAVAAGMIEDCDRLMGMINTMLDIAEAEAGMAEPKWAVVDMAEVIGNARDLFLPVAEEKEIVLTTEAAVGCRVRADARMLQRVVGNLLDNALKYTPVGGAVTISAWLQNENVMLRVRDSGIGISEKDLPRIFDKFYRCDRSRAEHGSGLGLSLVKAIVASHGGAIDVVSQPGKGAAFTVTLPRAADPGAFAGPSAPEAS
jgi:heavy metal sensor kinase